MSLLLVESDDLVLMQMQFIADDLEIELNHVFGGVEAIEFIKNNKVDVVISAWKIKTLSGVELVKRIRESFPSDYIYFIMQTSMGDTTSLVEGIDAGADDFIRKPIIEEEVKARINAGLRIRKLQMALLENNDKLDRALNHIRSDMVAAERLVQSTLPGPFEDEFIHIFCDHNPCQHIGGDTFGYRKVLDRYYTFYQIDVSGHGIPSALLSFTVNYDLSENSKNQDLLIKQNESGGPSIKKPSEVVKELNERYIKSLDDFMYFTMIYGFYDPVEGSIYFCQAGHPSPFLISDGRVELIGDGGFPVAMFDIAEYEDVEIKVSQEDRFFVCTDAIIECESKEFGLYDIDRLRQSIAKHMALSSSEMIEEVKREALAWSGESQFEDDQTIMLINCKGLKS